MVPVFNRPIGRFLDLHVGGSQLAQGEPTGIADWALSVVPIDKVDSPINRPTGGWSLDDFGFWIYDFGL